MQAMKRNGSIWSKLLMAILSVALVFTMMPLSMGTAYADTPPEGTVFTIVDTDGTARYFTLDEIKAFNGPKTEAYELSDGTMVKGIYVKALLKSYADAGKGSAVATVTTADDWSTVNADGKTVDYLRANDYILAYEVNGVEIDPSVEKTKPSGKTYRDAGYFYLYGKIDGEHKCDKYVDKIVLTESEEETPSEDTVFTIVDTDGTSKNFTLDEIKAFNGPKTEAYKLTDGTMVKGIYVKALLKSYADAGKGSAIASVTTADNYDQSKIKANGKTVDYLRANDYILAYEVNGVEIDPSVEKTKPNGKTYHDAGYFYLYGKIDGEHQCDKYVDKIVLSQNSGGEDPGDDPAEEAALIITGNALKSEVSFATLDELMNNENVRAKIKEDVVFNWKNSYLTEGTAKVTGITIADLIQLAGLKDNMEVKEINVSASDGWAKTYPADKILKADRDNNLAMYAWTYWTSDKNKTQTGQRRTIIGQFEEGEINQSTWGKDVNKIEVVGEEKAVEPGTKPAPAAKVIPKAPKIKTQSKGAKKAMIVSWGKVKNATSYKVMYRKAGSKWATKATKGTTLWIKGLKKGNMYEVKAIAVGKDGKSKASNVVYRYYKPAYNVKLKAKKKAVRVSWKKDAKATGYQVFCSTSKNMKNAKKVTVKGKTKCTISKLIKGKRYYVKVRPYITKNGHTYLGTMSRVKSVKTR